MNSIINTYLYNQDREGLLDFASKRKDFKELAKMEFLGFNDDLKKYSILSKQKVSNEKIVDCLLEFGLETKDTRAKHEIIRLMKEIMYQEDVKAVDDFIKESIKINKQLFIDAGLITEEETLDEKIIQKEDFVWEIEDMQEREKFLKRPIKTIKRGAIITTSCYNIDELNEDGYISYILDSEAIESSRVEENLIDNGFLEMLESNVYLVKKDFEARFKGVSKRELYSISSIFGEVKEKVYSVDILNKYRSIIVNQ